MNWAPYCKKKQVINLDAYNFHSHSGRDVGLHTTKDNNMGLPTSRPTIQFVYSRRHPGGKEKNSIKGEEEVREGMENSVIEVNN